MTPGAVGADRAPALATRARSLVGELLAPHREVVLLDVPSHPNVGDSAIWMGERAALAGAGRPPALECDLDAFDAERLRPAVEDRAVLLHGGGNFGDLWPPHQSLRERAIAAFGDRPVIQLPQSLCFRSADALERARRALGQHPDLTILCRDDRSLEVAERAFANARTLRCPDLALCLPSELLGSGPAPATREVLWLLRSDHESAVTEPPAAAVDWLKEPDSAATRLSRRLGPRAARRGPGLVRACHAAALRAGARRRIARGAALLRSARVVVTDRLHAHLLCVALGVPHVLLPDAFGKIAAHCETWPGLARHARRAADAAEAADRVRELLEGAA